MNIYLKAFCYLVLFILFPKLSSTEWSDPIRLTNGGNDRNPSFKVNQGFTVFNWEFLVFERKNGSNNNICITRIGSEGALENPQYITTNYNNTNPSVAYNSPSYTNPEISYALTVWQTDKNGNSDIYASRYTPATGWSAPFAVDSSGDEQTNPEVICIDSTNFGITYVSGNDIICKRYDMISNSFHAAINLTMSETSPCRNPYINFISFYNYYAHLIVSYEKEIMPGRFGIYYRYSLSESDPLNWSSSDTIAFAGDNQNRGFNSYTSNANCIFESDRSGNLDIFNTVVYFPQNIKFQSSLVTGPMDEYSYAGKDYGITDNLNSLNAYFKRNNQISAVISAWLLGGNQEFTISTNNNYTSNLSTSGDIKLNLNCFRYWIVYNAVHNFYPDSSGIIYGKYVTNCLTNVHSDETIPKNYFLFQNYPNPFNPVTDIRYSIPSNFKSQTSNVKLVVYDNLGKEIITLINGKQNPGSYSVDFNAEGLPSGVYFYRLEAGEFVETKTMILLK